MKPKNKKKRSFSLARKKKHEGKEYIFFLFFCKVFPSILQAKWKKGPFALASQPK
jgi:hypothetical protein